jgi:hypothetical protein
VIVSHCHIHVTGNNISKLSLWLVDIKEEGVLKSIVRENMLYFKGPREKEMHF